MNQDFKKHVGDFFTLLKGIFFFILFMCVTFMGGYMLGLHRISLPYIGKYIPMPAVESSTVSDTVTLPLSASDMAKFLASSNPLTPTAMQGKFARYKFSPYAERAFNFSAVLPIDWKAEPPKLHLDQGSLLENLDKRKDTQIALAQLNVPGAKVGLIQVMALNVPAEVGLDKFYSKLLAVLGATLVSDSPEAGGRKQALVKYTAPDGKPMLARTTAVRVGNYVMYLNCSAREADYAGYSDIFNLAGLSFSPEQATGLATFDASVPEATGYGAVIE